MTGIYNLEVKDIDLNLIKLDQYKGKTILIVNVASACGFTPQYKGLQSMYEKYKDKGLEILAFPCNQFGGQESGTNEEIRKISAPEELTSRKSQTEVRKVMRTLERKQFGDPECIDVLLATNMLSVGVDIGRLGLMVVNGQPKTMDYCTTKSRT